MQVISFAHLKGGVAKTTSALMMAFALKQMGYRVALVDLDLSGQLTQTLQGSKQAGMPIQTVQDWQQAKQTLMGGVDFYPTPFGGDQLEMALPSDDKLFGLYRQLEQHYDFCLLDCPSGFFPWRQAVLHLSHWQMVPTLLSPLMRSTSITYLMRMAKTAIAQKQTLKVFLLPVMYNKYQRSHHIGLESLKRLVGEQRVLSPIRQDRHLENLVTTHSWQALSQSGAYRDYQQIVAKLFSG